MIALTPTAAQKLKTLLARQNKPAGFLRIRVTSGGCSGLSYEFEISDVMAQDEQVFQSNGAKVVTNPGSLLYVSGTEVDYTEGLMKSGFELKNPNAVSSCSCGTSFSV